VILTDYNGNAISVPVDPEPIVEEKPAGQCMITLQNGQVIQVKETVRDVLALMEKEKKK
jgi:uncharacterized protein YlzI (FlbEa/FlbD family)